MSLRNKFKTNSKLANEGVWFEVAENSDGTKCRFRLGRMSDQNAEYTKALNAWAEKYRGDDGSVSLAEIENKAAEEAALKIFVDTVLLGWEHLQLEDDGNETEYNRENAVSLLSNKDWSDLYRALRDKASSGSNFRDKMNKDIEKN